MFKWLAACLLLSLSPPLPAAPGGVVDEPVFEFLQVDSTRFELQFASGFDAPARLEAAEWIARSARVVSQYLGRYPVDAVTILMVPADGDDVASGTTFNDGELRIRVRVGRKVTRERYLADWIMVHEMIHLAIPEVPRNQNWFHEGAATYVEIIARAQAGLSGERGGWAELHRNAHQGLPQPGDRGLDRTPTWGRTYWGGALFCLTADVEIRRATQNRRSLGDALREIVRRGGNVAVRRPIEDTLRIGDDATGTTVLTELYRQWANTPVRVDLPHLWRELGISIRGGAVRLSDDAPLAFVRRGIEGDGER